MKSAFTLIELLVVIAIIAILAAILFPVFARAKTAAYQISAVSNAKQQGTAIIMYSDDYDDTYPLAMSRLSNGSWGVKNLYCTPANAYASSLVTPDEEGVIWANSIQPYMKNYGILALPGGTDVDTGASFANPPSMNGLEYNGLFHALNGSTVASPSLAVVAWSGYGKYNIRGFTAANPVLNCGGLDDCRFNPGGPPQGDWQDATGTGEGSTMNIWNLDTDYFVYGQTLPIVRFDSSAKSVRSASVISTTQVAPSTSPNNAWLTPWDVMNTQGFPLTGWDCGIGDQPSGSPNSTSYQCYFRPDRTQ